jgi:NTP pyrophosphatase (non-canonical NTP hydrolase)
MDFNDYQLRAMRTASLKSFEGIQALQNAALGLAGEAGEFADAIKKVSFQGHTLNHAHLAQEVGDILWYCALAASALGMDLDDIAVQNVQKLQKRYPDGFEVERSMHRAD